MFIDGYTQKRAMQDALRFIAYRVSHPAAEPTDELHKAEDRLRMLTASELLDVVRDALLSGIRPGITQITTPVSDMPEGDHFPWRNRL